MNRFWAAVTMAAFAASSTAASASDVDWKFYGDSTVGGDEHMCFFDLRGAAQAPNRHIKVWTKCLSKKAIEGINIEKDFGGKILNNVTEKIIGRYIPPISLVEGIGYDQATEVATFEEIAGVSDIQPAARIFYELDCPKTILRELSIEVVDVDGRSGSRHSASDWKYVAPETNGARLEKILCEKSVAR
jgi:hypothetical protein